MRDNGPARRGPPRAQAPSRADRGARPAPHRAPPLPDLVIRGPDIFRGVAYIVGATLLFIIMNAGVKILSPHLPTLELIWARSLGHLVFIVAIFGPSHGGWRLLVTQRPTIQLARSLLLLTSTSLFFTAIGRVPLAEATAISFTAPLIVAGLAGPILGERTGFAHWMAILTGFGGALVVIRPGFGSTSPFAILVLGSAASYALYQLLTRRVAGIDRPETSVTYSALVGTIVLSAAVPFQWRTPDALWQWAILGALGLLGGVGHYWVARAFLLGPAAVISPIHYVALVWAAVIGFALFGDVPDAWSWLGSAIIIGSGLYIAWRETQRPLA